MHYEIKKSFEKDTDKIYDKKILKAINNSILNVDTVKSVKDIKNIKKLEGYKNYFRIRVGNYRIGLKLENNTIIFVRFLHRKEIYKYFP